MADIKLGMRVRDIVSGFTGIVTARTEFLNGCVRVGIDAEKLDRGSTVATQWFDVQQLAIVAANTKATRIAPAGTGGPRPDARRRPDAVRAGSR